MSADSAMPLPGGGYADPPDHVTDFQRQVANVLRRVPGLPWWRVVPADGRLYHQHREVAEPLLEADGQAIDEVGRVHVAGSQKIGCRDPRRQ